MENAGIVIAFVVGVAFGFLLFKALSNKVTLLNRDENGRVVEIVEYVMR